MNTACSPSTISPLVPLNTQRAVDTWVLAVRAWWTRRMAPRKAHLTQADLTALDGLTEETLKDIGAPEWMYERAHRAQERAWQGGLFERDSIHWR
ncbi:hypothetical protein [Rhodoferax sp.]|uniref:hypothetical protein n=1 Tax=Rhodoferax sp. TaxID=50421 RepID=UPI00283E6892|nr:hypothetical protein [Rhodoferax sp.]MDR3368344.1 hypothetical protein [Rhodoferax sp.]